MWSDVVALFRGFMGTGLIVILFLTALLYLWLREKRKYVRVLFIYTPLAVLLIYFNPLFSGFIYKAVKEEIYYRILWLLPITPVLAYSAVCAYGQLSGRKKEVFAVCMAGVIAVSGSCIYSNPYFHKAENLYHVPDSVVEICDAIQVPGREVMAVFPIELLQYVRQYSPVTCMPYGREILVDSWGFQYSLFDVMEDERIDLEKLVPLTREAGCHYVILRRDKEMTGIPEDYGWTLFQETEKYNVYRDPEIPLIIPEL